MAIRQIWKSQLTDQMVIQWLLCLRIAIQSLRLKLKRKWNLRYYENTYAQKATVLIHEPLLNAVHSIAIDRFSLGN